ncbi:MAG TPA: GNAT family protein [Clostridiaceae bacterium]
MKDELSVQIEKVKGSKEEYILKDGNFITIGRIFIQEVSTKNSSCSIKLNFYKTSDDSYDLLKQALRLILKKVFDNMGLNKVNIFTEEDINANSFFDLGFILEGILWENIIDAGEYKAELVFGILNSYFKSMERDRSFKLQSKNIYIKIFTPGDTKELLDYYIRNSGHLKKFEPTRDERFYTLQVQRRGILESYKQFLSGGTFNMGIYKDEKLIGKIQLSGIVMGVFKNAFIGYSMDQREQGKGYMKEALNVISEYAFTELGLHRLEASTLLDNLKSQRVLKSCGFTEFGISEKYLFIDGQWRDHKIFYRLKEN